MAFTEDLAPFFADFGIAATVGGVACMGIFDAAYADALGMNGTRPALQVATAAVPSVAEGAAVTIGAASYTVESVQPDGTGMTLLILHEAA
jgi:hypothetical protein